MSGRGAIRCASAQIVKNALQLVASGDDYSDTDRSQIKQQAEVVQISIVERILVIPFDLDSDPIPEAVYLMRWAILRYVVNNYLG